MSKDSVSKDNIEKIAKDVVNETTGKGEPTKSDKEDNAKAVTFNLSTISSSSIKRHNKMSLEERYHLNELKQQVQEFEEIKIKIKNEIEKIEISGEIDTQKSILLISLRHKKRGVKNHLRITLEEINEIEYEDEYKEKKIKEEEKRTENIDNIFKDNDLNDKRAPEKRDITKANLFSRNLNMPYKYKKDTINLKQEIADLMDQDTSTMSQQSIEKKRSNRTS